MLPHHARRIAVSIFPGKTCLASLAGSALILAWCLVARAQVREATPISPGLPSSKEAYLDQRRQLTRQSADMRFDATMELSAAEKRVDARLAALRTDLLKQYRDQKRFPPSEPFHTVKNEIRKTQLYELLRDMPKGGVLHIHTSSTAPASWVVEKGIREPCCYVCWPEDRGEAIRGQLGFFPPDKAPPGYQAVEAVLARDADFPSKLLGLITINSSDDALTNLEIWTKFNQIFQRMDGLLAYQPVFEKYYTAAFETLLADNVSYVELRTGFSKLYDLRGGTWDYRDRAELMWKLRNRLRETAPAFDLKLIYSGYRGVSVQKLWPQIKEVVELRKHWQKHNFVVGFDIVGEEDAGHRTEYFLADWIKLGAYLREQQTTLPLYFHDGESDWPQDDNLYDAYLLGSRRIGHGFNLFRFPILEKRFIADKVAVEVCPISNQQLRYVRDLRIHPASGYLNRGVPCVLGNDDPGIFGNDGLTYDYWETVVAWNLGLRSVKQLALNSLLYSAMTDEEKRIAIDRWRDSWDRWIARHAD
jgi:adenosine deaminase-related growth factor